MLCPAILRWLQRARPGSEQVSIIHDSPKAASTSGISFWSTRRSLTNCEVHWISTFGRRSPQTRPYSSAPRGRAPINPDIDILRLLCFFPKPVRSWPALYLLPRQSLRLLSPMPFSKLSNWVCLCISCLHNACSSSS